MRISLPANHELSIDPGTEWVVDELDPSASEQLGIGMNGEVVIEVFITDGRRVANFAGPAERNVARAITPSVQALAKTVAFGALKSP